MELVVVEPTDDSENGVGGGAGIIEGLVNLFGADSLLAARDTHKAVDGGANSSSVGPLLC